MPPDPQKRLAVWAEATFAGVLRDLGAVGEGGRNAALNSAAFRIGQLVGAGLLAEARAWATLLEAAHATGLPRAEALRTAHRAFHQGQAQPAEAPPEQPHQRPSSSRGKGQGRGMEKPLRTPPSPPAPIPPDTTPDATPLLALWAASRPVTDNPGQAQALAWLHSRALDPEAVALADLCRMLPAPQSPLYGVGGAPWPAFARIRGQSWFAAGYRLLFPLYDAAGELAGLRARYIGEASLPQAWPKSAAAAGFPVAGRIMACPQALRLLRAAGGAPPPGRLPGPPAREQAPLPQQVVIVEGEPDFLTWATRFSEAHENPPAVIGIVAGSWTTEIAARIPDRCRVIIRTDHDPAGHAYARTIYDSLHRRCEVLRGGCG